MTAKSRSTEGCGVVNTELDRHDEHAHEPAHDPHAEPSAEWGWHGGFPRGARIGGWIVAAVLFLMLIGNHQGHIEDLWLIAIGLIVVGILVRDQMKRRTSRRR